LNFFSYHLLTTSLVYLPMLFLVHFVGLLITPGNPSSVHPPSIQVVPNVAGSSDVGVQQLSSSRIGTTPNRSGFIPDAPVSSAATITTIMGELNVQDHSTSNMHGMNVVATANGSPSVTRSTNAAYWRSPTINNFSGLFGTISSPSSSGIPTCVGLTHVTRTGYATTNLGSPPLLNNNGVLGTVASPSTIGIPRSSVKKYSATTPIATSNPSGMISTTPRVRSAVSRSSILNSAIPNNVVNHNNFGATGSHSANFVGLNNTTNSMVGTNPSRPAERQQISDSILPTPLPTFSSTLIRGEQLIATNPDGFQFASPTFHDSIKRDEDNTSTINSTSTANNVSIGQIPPQQAPLVPVAPTPLAAFLFPAVVPNRLPLLKRVVLGNAIGKFSGNSASEAIASSTSTTSARNTPVPNNSAMEDPNGIQSERVVGSNGVGSAISFSDASMCGTVAPTATSNTPSIFFR
jgi:hypothetical protein